MRGVMGSVEDGSQYEWSMMVGLVGARYRWFMMVGLVGARQVGRTLAEVAGAIVDSTSGPTSRVPDRTSSSILSSTSDASKGMSGGSSGTSGTNIGMSSIPINVVEANFSWLNTSNIEAAFSLSRGELLGVREESSSDNDSALSEPSSDDDSLPSPVGDILSDGSFRGVDEWED